MSTTCARCGLRPATESGTGDACFGRLGSDSGDLKCRDRELANLRSLLRSVTGKLEEALEALEAQAQTESALRAYGLIDSVLEVLS